MFNTTCRIDANGYVLQDFISKDLHNIFEDFKAEKSYKNINMQLKSICKTAKEHLDKAATKHKTYASKAIVDEIYQSNNAHGNEQARIANGLNNKENAVDKETHKSADTAMAIDEISTCSREGEESFDSKIQNDKILAIDVNLENSKTEENSECQGCERPLTNTSAIECSACKLWFHTSCEGLTEYHIENHIYDSYTCSYCKTLDLTIPYEDRPYQEETLPKQIMNSTHIEVSNEQPNLTTPQTNVHKENKLEGSVDNRSEHQHIVQEDEVPTAPQISRNTLNNEIWLFQMMMLKPNQKEQRKEIWNKP
ncbi:unnamed protein product [Mytilus coruscus]|uniref:Zinc finger PHD-type domain-containing protein n=1 Tax=Mytilus coruscus TaxID=42192 RepID=A0A6J8DKL1_MYTCO|nr:unnamed protein product [Mytilus coruscus]